MSEQDRRTAARQNLPIEVEFWCDSTRHQGRIEDLSEGGAYFYTGISWPSGRTICFSFKLPGSEETIEGTGTVVWSEYMGFGLRFDSLEDEAREQIRELVGTRPEFDRRGSSLDKRLRSATG